MLLVVLPSHSQLKVKDITYKTDDSDADWERRQPIQSMLLFSLRLKPLKASFRCYPKKNEHFWECLSFEMLIPDFMMHPKEHHLGFGEMSQKNADFLSKSYWTVSSGLLDGFQIGY